MPDVALIGPAALRAFYDALGEQVAARFGAKAGAAAG